MSPIESKNFVSVVEELFVLITTEKGVKGHSEIFPDI